MEPVPATSSKLQAKRMHPLLMAAAAAVLVFSLIGSAAVLGWLPTGHTEKDQVSDKNKGPGKVAEKVASVRCPDCGTISAINASKVKGDTSGVGAVAGGVTGALVGNQFGKGDGKAAMTVVGAAGGAYAGNEIEKNVKAQTVYSISVKMNDGTVRSVSQNQPPAYVVGDKVRVINGVLHRPPA